MHLFPKWRSRREFELNSTMETGVEPLPCSLHGSRGPSLLQPQPGEPGAPSAWPSACARDKLSGLGSAVGTDGVVIPDAEAEGRVRQGETLTGSVFVLRDFPQQGRPRREQVSHQPCPPPPRPVYVPTRCSRSSPLFLMKQLREENHPCPRSRS